MNLESVLPALVLASGALSVACGGMLSNAGKAQDAAQNLNMDARLGRMEFALEHVDTKHRESFTKIHTAWGAKIRIVDSEITTFKMKGDDSADVNVQISWYRPEFGDLHITVLHQSWHNVKGDWFLASEERTDGDTGLLGEPVLVQEPEEVAPRAQFQSIRITD